MRKFEKSMLFVCLPLALAACRDVAQVSPELLLADSEPVVVGDAVYLLSRASGAVVRVIPGEQGEDAYTDQEGAERETIQVGRGPEHLVVTPDQRRILVLNHDNQLHQLNIIDLEKRCNGDGPVDTGCVTSLEAQPLHDSLVLSPDGRFAISYISPESAQYSSADVVNLNEVGVYDLTAGAVRFTPLGFDPRSFAFTKDAVDPRVVAITSSKVVLMDLLTGDLTPRELTLSTDTQLRPQQVVLTGDDAYALVTIVGSPDLFTFDLTQENLPINILSLSGAPTQMARSASGDETLVITDSGYGLDIVHHADFHIDSFVLEQRANHILTPAGASYAALYDDGGGQYLYYVDLVKGRVQPYLLDNPCGDVKVSPDGGALVIFYTPGYGDSLLSHSNAVAILNLAQNDRQPNPILVSSYPAGAAFFEGPSPELDEVFVPFDGDDHGLVAWFNLSTYSNDTVETPPGPRMISLMSDDRLLVVHAAAGGLISIFPQSDPHRIQFISGFMTAGLF